MNLQTMRLIADMPNRGEPKGRADAPGMVSGRSLTLLAGRVLPSILAVVIGGHLLL
jgi:hypothetical protein